MGAPRGGPTSSPKSSKSVLQGGAGATIYVSAHMRRIAKKASKPLRAAPRCPEDGPSLEQPLGRPLRQPKCPPNMWRIAKTNSPFLVRGFGTRPYIYIYRYTSGVFHRWPEHLARSTSRGKHPWTGRRVKNPDDILVQSGLLYMLNWSRSRPYLFELEPCGHM